MLIHVIHYDHERQCCLAFWNFTEERYQGTEYYQQPHHLISNRIKHLFWFQKKLSPKDKNIEFSLNLMSILPQQCCEDWNTGELARIGQVVTSPTTLATTNCQN